jgi:membrane protein
VRDYRSTGLVSIFVLLITAGLFFNALEQSVKRVFSVRSRRTWIAKTRVMGFIVSVMVLMALGSYAWGGVELMEVSGFGPLISAIIVAIGFNLVIYWFASFRTRPRYVAAGATLMCLLWTAAHYGFGYYLENATRLSELYGALTGVAVLMVWIYYATLIFLFSCSFVQALNLREGPDPAGNSPK